MGREDRVQLKQKKQKPGTRKFLDEFLSFRNVELSQQKRQKSVRKEDLYFTEKKLSL